MKKIHHILLFLFAVSVGLFLFEKYKVAPARLQTFITSYTDKLQQSTVALNSIVEKNIKQESWNYLFLTKEIHRENLENISNVHPMIRQVEIFNARGHWLAASDKRTLFKKINWNALAKQHLGRTVFAHNRRYTLYPVYQNQDDLLGFVSLELKPVVFDKSNIVFLSDAQKKNIILPNDSLSKNGKQELKNILHDNSFYAENYLTASVDGISRDIFLHPMKGSIANLGVLFPSPSIFSFAGLYLIIISFLMLIFSVFVYPAIKPIQKKRQLKNEKKAKIEKILKAQKETLSELKTQMEILQNKKSGETFVATQPATLSEKQETSIPSLQPTIELSKEKNKQKTSIDTQKIDSPNINQTNNETAKTKDENIVQTLSFKEKEKKDLLTDFTFLDPLSMDNFEKEKQSVARELAKSPKKLDTTNILSKEKNDTTEIKNSEPFEMSTITPMQDTVSLLEEDQQENDILSMDVPIEVKEIFRDNARKIKDIREKISQTTDERYVEQRIEAQQTYLEKPVQDAFSAEISLGDFPNNIIKAKDEALNLKKENDKIVNLELIEDTDEEILADIDNAHLEEQSLTNANLAEVSNVEEEIIMFDDSEESLSEGIIMFDNSEESKPEEEVISREVAEIDSQEKLQPMDQNIPHAESEYSIPVEKLSQQHIDKIRSRVFSQENKKIFEKVATNATLQDSRKNLQDDTQKKTQSKEQTTQDADKPLSKQESFFQQIDSFSENPPTHQWGIFFDALNKLYLGNNTTKNLSSIFAYFQEILSANGLTYITYNSLMRCYQSEYQSNLEALNKLPLYILENDPLLIANEYYRYFSISEKSKEDIYFFKKFPFEILERLQGIFVISLKKFGVNGFLMATYFESGKQKMVEGFSERELDLQIQQMIPALKSLQAEYTSSVSVDNLEKMVTEFRLLSAQKENENEIKVLHCFSYGKILPSVFHTIQENTSSTLRENERVFYLSPDHIVFFLKETPSSSISNMLLKHVTDVKIENYNFPEDGSNPYLYL